MLSAAVPYRPEIDGLRAVAVLAVVLFHAKLGPFTGGYVGVDVFFVISGFLITSIVVREIDAGAFSFADFYERRVRRIFPALFVVIAAAFVVGWFLLTPKDYQDFARSAMHTAVFTSNFVFNERAGYFAPAAETQPLLHTWSLAVEEQFYLIAPFALLLLHKLSLLQRVFAVTAVFFASLIAAEYGVRHEWPSAFFLLPARAWELMTGMVLALGFIPAMTLRRTSEVFGLVGLGLIAAAIAGYTSQTPFPGLSALAPCLGAALVIHSTSAHASLTQRALSAAPVVAIGKISYSLYLWHWPLLAFAAYGWADDIGDAARIGLITLAFVLSGLTWRYVEQPARSRSAVTRQKRVFQAGSAVMIACLLAGFAIVRTDGVLQRLPLEAQAFAAKLPDKLRANIFCLRDHPETSEARDVCQIGAERQDATFVLWGDSHAGALVPAVADVARDLNRSGVLLQTNGFPPLLGLNALPKHSFGRNLKPDKSVLAVIARAGISDVIIHARWALYAEGSRSRGENSSSLPRFDVTSPEANHAEFSKVLRQTVQTITGMGRRVTLIMSVPELPYNLPSEVIKDMMLGRGRDYALPRSAFDHRQMTVRKIFADLAQLPGIRVIYPDQALCDADRCWTLQNGHALYFDDDHLSAEGAAQLGGALRDALTPIR